MRRGAAFRAGMLAICGVVILAELEVGKFNRCAVHAKRSCVLLLAGRAGCGRGLRLGVRADELFHVL